MRKRVGVPTLPSFTTGSTYRFKTPPVWVVSEELLLCAFLWFLCFFLLTCVSFCHSCYCDYFLIHLVYHEHFSLYQSEGVRVCILSLRASRDFALKSVSSGHSHGFHFSISSFHRYRLQFSIRVKTFHDFRVLLARCPVSVV